MQADDDDIDEELERMAATDGRTASQLREVMADTDGLAHLASAICKSKALQWAIEAATLIGPDGDTIERSALELPTPDDPGSDGDGSTGDAGDPGTDPDGTDPDDIGDAP